MIVHFRGWAVVVTEQGFRFLDGIAIMSYEELVATVRWLELNSVK